MTAPDPTDPRLAAGISLLRRTGLRQLQLRYSDDEEPIVWMAVGQWKIGKDGRPVRGHGETHHEVMAGMHPLAAVQRLLDQMVDGGKCPACHRMTNVVHETDHTGVLEAIGCSWHYNDELQVYVRGCDGLKATG